MDHLCSWKLSEQKTFKEVKLHCKLESIHGRAVLWPVLLFPSALNQMPFIDAYLQRSTMKAAFQFAICESHWSDSGSSSLYHSKHYKKNAKKNAVNFYLKTILVRCRASHWPEVTYLLVSRQGWNPPGTRNRIMCWRDPEIWKMMLSDSVFQVLL